MQNKMKTRSTLTLKFLLLILLLVLKFLLFRCMWPQEIEDAEINHMDAPSAADSSQVENNCILRYCDAHHSGWCCWQFPAIDQPLLFNTAPVLHSCFSGTAVQRLRILALPQVGFPALFFLFISLVASFPSSSSWLSE